MNGRLIRVKVLVVTSQTPSKVLEIKCTASGVWGLPRTYVRDGEAISSAAARVMVKQLRLEFPLVRAVGIDHAPSTGPDGAPDTLTFVMEGGRVSDDTARYLERAPKSDRRLAPVRWTALDDLAYAPPVVRYAVAMQYTDTLTVAVLTDGLTDMEMCASTAAKGALLNGEARRSS
ncbi:hypothetical protein ACIQXD_29680 [Streptomyces uncialis]|uniref:hypothetical protein n=1 Tax=Streptomyces uncialis TaxID=1048205 RepID=UPI0038148048